MRHRITSFRAMKARTARITGVRERRLPPFLMFNVIPCGSERKSCNKVFRCQNPTLRARNPAGFFLPDPPPVESSAAVFDDAADFRPRRQIKRRDSRDFHSEAPPRKRHCVEKRVERRQGGDKRGKLPALRFCAQHAVGGLGSHTHRHGYRRTRRTDQRHGRARTIAHHGKARFALRRAESRGAALSGLRVKPVARRLRCVHPVVVGRGDDRRRRLARLRSRGRWARRRGRSGRRHASASQGEQRKRQEQA